LNQQTKKGGLKVGVHSFINNLGVKGIASFIGGTVARRGLSTRFEEELKSSSCMDSHVFIKFRVLRAWDIDPMAGLEISGDLEMGRMLLD
jgi:hypothetical protein